MKRSVLDRYERIVGGSLIIDVSAAQVEELYNDYDRSAPYIRRDLDQDLVDYLIECAKEIMPEAFVVRLKRVMNILGTTTLMEAMVA